MQNVGGQTKSIMVFSKNRACSCHPERMSSSNLVFPETVLPAYLNFLHLTSVPRLISVCMEDDVSNFGGWSRPSVFLMLIFRLNWAAAFAN